MCVCAAVEHQRFGSTTDIPREKNALKLQSSKFHRVEQRVLKKLWCLFFFLTTISQTIALNTKELTMLEANLYISKAHASVSPGRKPVLLFILFVFKSTFDMITW